MKRPREERVEGSIFETKNSPKGPKLVINSAFQNGKFGREKCS